MLMTPQAISLAILLVGASAASAGELPDGILRQLPHGYSVLLSATSSFGQPQRRFYFVALAARDEPKSTHEVLSRAAAPARPLLIYKLGSDGRYVLKARNDHVVLSADAGGLAGNGCDPLEGHRIATKGPYFTVEGGISCGAHWTDYVTFRFDPRSERYVFDNERFQSWSPGRDPGGDALVADPPKITRAGKGSLKTFEAWRSPGQ